MSEEIVIKEIELTKLKLRPGDAAGSAIPEVDSNEDIDD